MPKPMPPDPIPPVEPIPSVPIGKTTRFNSMTSAYAIISGPLQLPIRDAAGVNSTIPWTSATSPTRSMIHEPVAIPIPPVDARMEYPPETMAIAAAVLSRAGS